MTRRRAVRGHLEGVGMKQERPCLLECFVQLGGAFGRRNIIARIVDDQHTFAEIECLVHMADEAAEYREAMLEAILS